jgi:hypothetical protein
MCCLCFASRIAVHAHSAHVAGIEGTISQDIRRMGVRQARYIGQARTHLQHVATAAAINIERITDWVMGERPEPTRLSPLRALVTSP